MKSSRMYTKNDCIFFFIVFLFAGSASNVCGNTNLTIWALRNASICSAITVTCRCPDQYNEFKIYHVDNCSDTKNICIPDMDGNCPGAGPLEPCVFHNPRASKDRPNVSSTQLVRDSFEDQSSVVLPCIIKSNSSAVNVNWLFKGETIQKRIDSGFYASQKSPDPRIKCRPPKLSTLTLYSIKKYVHEGEYTCLATNNFGQANWTIYMNVRGKRKPSIKVRCKEDNTAYLGSSFNLTCEAFFSNHGPSNAKYLRGKIRVEDDSRHNLQQEGSKFVMMINNVSEKDAGVWEFRATQFPSIKNIFIELHVVPCPMGFYCPMNESTARPCPPGTYNDGKLNITYNCLPCPNHETNDSKKLHRGAKSIKNCPTRPDNENKTSNKKGKVYWPYAFFSLLVVLLPFVIWKIRRSRRKRNKPGFQALDVDTDLQIVYDVFISFSEKDKHFGKTLQSKIEEQGFKCCYHHRDFLPGECIMTNIADAIYQSTVTLLVLSPSYLKSDYCRHELLQASTATVEQTRVLPVLYKQCRKLPREISHLTYLEYEPEHERKFWRKLLDAIEKFCRQSNKRIEYYDSEV